MVADQAVEVAAEAAGAAAMEVDEEVHQVAQDDRHGRAVNSEDDDQSAEAVEDVILRFDCLRPVLVFAAAFALALMDPKERRYSDDFRLRSQYQGKARARSPTSQVREAVVVALLVLVV